MRRFSIKCTASGELFRGGLPHWCPVKNMNNGYKKLNRETNKQKNYPVLISGLPLQEVTNCKQ
jgi:hypothetical protein